MFEQGHSASGDFASPADITGDAVAFAQQLSTRIASTRCSDEEERISFSQKIYTQTQFWLGDNIAGYTCGALVTLPPPECMTALYDRVPGRVEITVLAFVAIGKCFSVLSKSYQIFRSPSISSGQS